MINTEQIFDVLIVGAGITGLTTALLLQQAGKRCVIVEAKKIGFGTSSATTAHLNTMLDTHYYEISRSFGSSGAELMAKGAKQAINLVFENVRTYHISCGLKLLDAFLFSESKQQSKNLEYIRKGMKEVNVEASYTSSVPVPIPFDKALIIPAQAQFDPVRYLNGLAQAFEAAGGLIVLNRSINRSTVKDHGDYSIALAGAHEVKARNIVYATHIPPGISLLNFECAPYRSYVLAAQIDGTNYPEGLVYDMRDPYDYFRTAYISDKRYLMVGGFDHKTGHGQDTEKVMAQLEVYVRKYYKVISVDYTWSSQYYQSTDGLPYIGRLPGAGDNTYMATGFSGAGMTLGTLSGKILCDLIITGESEFEDLLSPSRIKAIAGFSKFIKENADVVKHFIGDRIAIDDLKEVKEVNCNEGRVVNYEGRRYALYRDASGDITLLDPVCPHAKCLVQWNNAEKSWDCPCHGSRFSVDGCILNGPAVEPLRKVSLEAL
jgi:glycine/D-amino acid oxidase-like deaminating enzyme/nitrite reductase/ring-hydroxylating ferredoxin subunit